jgi:hypothetical protein
MKKSIFLMMMISSIILNFFPGTETQPSAEVLVNVPETFQEHNQWCWDATSKATLDYYGSVVDQCVIANWAWGRADCCENTNFSWSHPCNQPNYMYGTSGSLQGILQHWGVNNNSIAAYLPMATVVSELNTARPFVMRFGWTSGGGHFLVGRGYDQGGGDYLNYMDPWPGHGYTKSLYSWVVSASDHNWTHTLQITTNPPDPPKPNLTPYQPSGWSDKIVVSNAKGTNTDTNPIYSTDTLYVDWAVKNDSDVAISSTFNISLYIDNVQINTWYPDSLGAHYYGYVNDYPIGSLSQGTHVIKVIIDSTGVISETNESDNVYTKTFTVLGAGPNLTGEWTSFYQTCKSTSSGIKCKLKGSLRIHNVGNLGAISTNVNFYLYDGDYHFLKSVSTGKVKAAASKTKKISYNLPAGSTASEKYITAWIDAAEIVEELDEDDNFPYYGPIP